MTKDDLRKELEQFEKKEAQAKMTYKLVQIVVFLLALGLWTIGWQRGAVATVLLIWNFFWYERGCQSQVVDEYEDGYPIDGLLAMFRSWILFAILAGLFLVLVLDF